MKKTLLKKIMSVMLMVAMVVSIPGQGMFSFATQNADSVVKKGEAVVDSYNYKVTADVTVEGNKIKNVAFGNNAETTGHTDSLAYIFMADQVKEKFKNIAADDRNAILGVDNISGATLTVDAYKKAVLDALELKDEDDSVLVFGSGKKSLAPGTYTVPISLRHAAKHENNSNAAAAFPAMGTLEVYMDGTAALTTDFKPVTIGPITDMAYDVKYYESEPYKDGQYIEGIIPKDVKILESKVKPEPMPGAGKEVPTKIQFPIPDNNADGVFLNFTVDAMGPDSPDAWLKIDYNNAKVPGKSEVYSGTAKVNQFGKYTVYTDVTVTNGVITDISVREDDFISETHKPTNIAKMKRAKEGLKTVWNDMAPTQENAEKIFKAIMSKTNPDNVIDSVSGATYSAKAIRDSVMNAFGLEFQDEVINVPKNIEPGVYEVTAQYYSDIVWHSLVDTPKTKAKLTVNNDKSMKLELNTVSGTEREPLYILDFNGVYPDNDKNKKLTKEGCKYEMGLSSNDYEDEFFKKGTKVVNHLEIPLLGGLSKIYASNCYLYVPAMKKLNGVQSGISFENGKFNVDIFAKIFWDDIKKTGDVPAPQPEKKPIKTVTLSSAFKQINGVYTIGYNGSHMKAIPTVRDASGKVLKNGTDYTVKYSSDKRINAGKYLITVTGKGNYKGVITKKLVIRPGAPATMGSRLAIGNSAYDDIYAYWGNAKGGATGYYVSYKKSTSNVWSKFTDNKNTKTFLKRNMADGVLYNIKVVPYYLVDGVKYKSDSYRISSVRTLRATTLNSVRKYNSGSVKVSWNNIEGETGYQISRALSKNGTYTLLPFASQNGTSRIIKTIRNKGYYYKIRAYKNVTKAGKTYKVYAPWSNVKYLKIK